MLNHGLHGCHGLGLEQFEPDLQEETERTEERSIPLLSLFPPVKRFGFLCGSCAFIAVANHGLPYFAKATEGRHGCHGLGLEPFEPGLQEETEDLDPR